ncbi:MAG TPA: septal ring lytic transglycosylase RlpA family protein [Nitrospiria bacterium]
MPWFPSTREAFRVISGFIIFLSLTSCATLPQQDIPYGAGYREPGVASWYGKPFHGRKTASGEVYNMHKLTAAHRLMPLGTIVRVTHRKNGRSVKVKVNDRGPFIRGRNLDLSYGAAKRLDMVKTGTAPVMIEVLRPPENSKKSSGRRYTVQVGAFKSHASAKKLAEDLSLDFSHVYLVKDPEGGRDVYRVRVGSKREKTSAISLAGRLSREKGLDTFVTLKE